MPVLAMTAAEAADLYQVLRLLDAVTDPDLPARSPAPLEDR